MNRSVIVYKGQILTNSLNETKKLRVWLADDIDNQEAHPSCHIVKLPRRLFRLRASSKLRAGFSKLKIIRLLQISS
jgi:hypothetical protein